jgi:P-type E1-E2 ATPase
VIATIDSQRVWVGGRRLLDAERISIDTLARSALDAAESRGETAILTANSSGVQGVISMTTRPRTEAAGIVHFLVDHGIAQVALISGDAEAPTHALAQALGIESAYDRVLPEDKAARVRELQQQGHRICFIGDGVNDALAMRQADCSVSLRGAAELATDTASILLLDGSLRGLPRLLTTARAQQTQLRRMLNYWGGYAVLNTGLALGLGVGVLPSSLLFGTVFGVGLLVAQPRSPQSSHRVSGPAAYAATDAGGENE